MNEEKIHTHTSLRAIRASDSFSFQKTNTLDDKQTNKEWLNKIEKVNNNTCGVIQNKKNLINK